MNKSMHTAAAVVQHTSKPTKLRCLYAVMRSDHLQFSTEIHIQKCSHTAFYYTRITQLCKESASVRNWYRSYTWNSDCVNPTKHHQFQSLGTIVINALLRLHACNQFQGDLHVSRWASCHTEDTNLLPKVHYYKRPNQLNLSVWISTPTTHLQQHIKAHNHPIPATIF